MTRHFVQLELGNKTFKDKVSTEGCQDVADFREAIKNKWTNLLKDYDAGQLVLFQPDGTTEIDPQTSVSDLKEIPWKPMVVTVDELPIPVPIGSSKKQLTYKGLSSEASCRKYFDALAIAFFLEYDFPKKYGKPTMGDVLAAFRGTQGKCEQTKPGVTWWDYRQNDGQQLTNVPLPSRLTAKQWKTLEKLNRKTSDRIHDALLPLTTNQKPFIILHHNDFMDADIVNDLKSIAAIFGIVSIEADFIVKDELDLSGSSSSESGSPDKDKKM